MGDARRRQCKRCGAQDPKGQKTSWTGLCPECAKAAVEDNVEGLVTRRSDTMRRWRQGMAASVGAILLDDAAVVTDTDARAD